MNGMCISVRLFKVCISLGEGERDAKKKAGTTWVSITLIPTLDDIKYGLFICLLLLYNSDDVFLLYYVNFLIFLFFFISFFHAHYY